MTPEVSFIVPCYNYGRFLSQCLDSLLSQTFSNLEIVAIDDASPDETSVVLNGYENERRVKIIRHERNIGHLRTYNEGISLVQGRYVGILSADDYCLTLDAVESQVGIFEEHPNVGMVYTGHAVIRDGVIMETVIPSDVSVVRAGLDEFNLLMWGNHIPHSGTLLRTDVQRELGPYDLCLPHTGDWDMWLRASIRHDVGCVAKASYAYRMHGSNMRHRSITPAQAADQGVVVLEKALSSLGDGIVPDRRRRAAFRHALLQNGWFDLHQALRFRTLQTLGHALKRDPAIFTSREFCSLAARLVLAIGLGEKASTRLVEGLQHRRLLHSSSRLG